eukprot:scaffold5114_cov67-Cylindrotheca_fusiformis.AAC.4
MTCIQKDKCSSSALVSDNNNSNNNNSHVVSIGNGVDTMPLEAVVSLLTNVIAQQQKQKLADNTISPSQKSRKRVRFSTTTNNNNNNNDNNGVLQHKAPALMKELTLETARKLWYSKADIAAFKTQAKQIVLNKAHTSEDISGFERFDAKRSKEKKSTLHFVILSQMVKRDAEFQRHVSRKCTAGAKVIALNQALEDFCAVYDPLACLLGASSDGKKYHESLFMGNPALNCSTNTNNKRSVEQMLQVPTVHEIPAMVSEFNAVGGGGGGEATVTPCYPPNTTTTTTTTTTSRRVRRRVTPPLTAWT